VSARRHPGSVRGSCGARRVVIGSAADLGYVDVDPEIATLVAHAVAILSELGAHVDELNPGFADPVEAFNILW